MSVVVVGSANLDVVARVPRIPGAGETLLATGFSRGGGGKGANQAVAAARAGGAETWFVGAVGDDADGRFLASGLAAAGVRTDVVATSSTPTGTALITVADDGENAIVVVGGANQAFDELSDEQAARVGEAAVVLTQLEVPLGTLAQAASARRPGALLVLNAAPSAPLPEELWAQVDVLVVNEHEAIDLAAGLAAGLAAAPAAGDDGPRGADHTGDLPAELASAVEVLAARVPALVVTLGGRGSIVVADGRRTAVPAPQVTPVDTTGAGDTFCGVLAARLAAGDHLVEAARWGAAAAALAVQRPGAQSGVPTAAETRAAREDLP